MRNVLVGYQALHEALQLGVKSALEGPDAGAGEEALKAQALARLSHALRELGKEESRPGVMVAVQDQTASLLQTLLAKKALEEKDKRLIERSDGTLEVKFDEHDVLGWVGSFLADWWKQIRRHKFIEPSANLEGLGDSCRVALFSDWGTGLYGAPVLSKSIAQDPKGYQLIMHLGDVYYAGDHDEIQERCLDRWPWRQGAIHRALNANHEMYTGGNAYFKKLLPKLGQRSSCFALANNHWILVGLDTAHKDHDLAGGQVKWVKSFLDQAGDRKVIFLSHHQPFSLLDKQGPKLVEKLGDFLDERRVFAWYWGHEHRCVFYDYHPFWGMHGRCIGHGGYPYFREKDDPVPAKPAWKRREGTNLVPGGRILDGNNPHVPGYENEYGPHGYVTLELSDVHLNEIVHLADGQIVDQKQLA